MTDLHLPGVPFPFAPSGSPACAASVTGGTLTLTGGPKSDLFIDPAGDEGARPDAGRWTGLPGGSGIWGVKESLKVESGVPVITRRCFPTASSREMYR